MKKYDKYSMGGKRKGKIWTENAYKEGVFEVPSGKFIVRIRKGKNKTYSTLSMHDTKIEAEEIYKNLKE